MAALVTIVDGDPTERKFLAAVLAAEGLDVVQVPRLVDGIVAVLDWHPALVVLAEGEEALAIDDVLAVLRRVTDAPVVVVGSGGTPDEIESLRSGSSVYLQRPLSAGNVLLRARALLREHNPSSYIPISPNHIVKLSERHTHASRRSQGGLSA